MFALPGLLVMIFFDYLRPQEFFVALRPIPSLHLAVALAALGALLDLRLGVSRLRTVPHLAFTAAFFLWCVVTLVVRAPEQLASRVPVLVIPFVVYLLVAHAIQSFRSLEITAAVLLTVCLVLAGFGVYQAASPMECRTSRMVDGIQVSVSDGRACTHRIQCELEGADPTTVFECEKGGLLGTYSVGGRVRYRGTLADPNELALALSIAMPFALAFFDRRRTPMRLFLVVLTVAWVGICAYYTQSRGGQLVFLTVLATYFVKRVGMIRGAMAGLLLSLPLILLAGGRGDAAASTQERTECWHVGLQLLAGSPVFGVGAGQFTEHHILTAHNSFILAAAELGVPGLLLWTSIAWLAVKIPLQALRTRQHVPVVRSWALALLASTLGLLVGVFLLSFIYRNLLWVYLGLSGVLYGAIRRHDPSFRVGYGVRDLVGVAAVDAALIGALFAFTASKVG